MQKLTEDQNFSTTIKTLEYETIEKKYLSGLHDKSAKDYQREIKDLSSKLAQADSMVKELIFRQEKIKQMLSLARVENSNLVLANRSLRIQLAKLGAKAEENENLIKRINERSGSEEEQFFNEIDIDKAKTKAKCGDEGTLNINLETKARVLEVVPGKSMFIRCFRPKLNFCILEHQYEISIFVKRVKKVRFANVNKLEVSRTISYGYKRLKQILRVKYQGSVSVLQHKYMPKLNGFTCFTPSNTSNAPQYNPVQLNFASITKMSIIPKHNNKKPNSMSRTSSFFYKPVNSISKTPQVNSKARLSIMKFPIFVNQIGRCQVEQLESDDENNLDIVVPKRIFNLSISRTVKSAYMPKIKKLSVQKQISVHFKANLSKVVKKVIKSSKTQSIEIRAYSFQLKKQVFKGCSIIAQGLDKDVFKVFSVFTSLSIKKQKYLSFIPDGSGFDSESIDSTNDRGRKNKRAVKRASAIEEYFTLVCYI